MKLEKITHDHLLTKWLKVIIFAILMLAPIFSVAVRCAYVVCNKNAYQSYSGNEITENTFINTYDDFILNETYYFNNGVASQTYHDYGGNGYNMYVNKLTNYKTQTEVANANYVSLYIASNGTVSLTARDISGNYLLNISNNDINNYNFVYNGVSQTLQNNFSNFFDLDIVYKINRVSTLDNVFDYSVNQLKNDQLFNWTQNTGVYTGVNAMTTGLGLTDGTISILITYWTLLSIIYVIIDIVLEGFVALTHMILKKAS